MDNNPDISSYVSRIINTEMTPTMKLFFSNTNVDIIQKLLQVNVFKLTGNRIDDQSVTDLITIMSETYANFGFNDTEPATIVTRLDEAVIDNATKQIVNSLTSYKKYLGYIQDVQEPLPYGQNTSSYGDDVRQAQIGI